MKIYTSSKQVPGLETLTLTERLAVMERAFQRLTVPEKTLMNVLKLLVIVPVFIFILRVQQDWVSLIWAALVLALYPIFINPMKYSLAAKYVPELLNKNGA